MASIVSKDDAVKDGESDNSKRGSERAHIEEPPPKKQKANVDPAETIETLKDLKDSIVRESISNSRVDGTNIQCDYPERLKYSDDASFLGVQQRMLPPIVLESTHPTRLPSSLERLNPETRIEVFNRKIGKIKSGEDAIRVQDLPRALLLHAEYEPIVPSDVALEEENGAITESSSLPSNSSLQKSVVARKGRSAPNVRVSRTVLPQKRGLIFKQNKEGTTERINKSGHYRGPGNEEDLNDGDTKDTTSEREPTRPEAKEKNVDRANASEDKKHEGKREEVDPCNPLLQHC